jgi:hypothetical protein
MTANLTEADDAGHRIRATVRADGSTIVNDRNTYSQNLRAR